MITMQAVIYARQSSGKEDFSESVEAQIDNCRKLAAREKINVKAVFFDLNTSGETYPAGAEKTAEIDLAYQRWIAEQSSKRTYRPGLGKVMDELKNVDVIIVNELTRLYRPVIGSFLEGYINCQLKENRVCVLQVQGGVIDLSKFDQLLITTIKNQILYDDIQKKRQNSINAFRIKRDSGKLCCGTRIFGIKYLGNDKLQIRPECVDTIRFIYSSICKKRSYASIAKECNERFYPDKFFYQSTIISIATQPLYAGYQYNSAGKLIKNTQITGQEIITLFQWEKVQHIINTKRKISVAAPTKRWLPLSGKLFCGNCGSKLICTIDNDKVYYCCNRGNLSKEHSACKSNRIRFETGAYGNPALFDAVYPLLAVPLLERYYNTPKRCNTDLITVDSFFRNFYTHECNYYCKFLQGQITIEDLKVFLAQQKKQKNSILRKITSHLWKKTATDQTLNMSLTALKILAAKRISQDLYESLLTEAELSAVVFNDRVIFQTKYGDLTLPRQKQANRRWMPEWEIKIKRLRNDPDKKTEVVIIYHTGKKSLLASWGLVKIKSL